ncbi:caspase-8 [Cylas formicarius]|uniref:caspase-8 n=1 Tax=Cylas formicarius TaxID=197179 RepID=UPI0029585395|nr:caspase-8 [Cylas formicarius]
MFVFDRIVKLINWNGAILYTSDISDEESDSEYLADLNESPKSDADKSMNATDAAVRTTTMPSPQHLFDDLARLTRIEASLRPHETVSLVFLLYEGDMRQLALQELQIMVLSGGSRDLLYNWARHRDSAGDGKWQLKIVEALCIVQNYKVLRELGYAKQDAKARFCPDVESVSEVISKDRKMLYRLAEKLTNRQTEEFLCRMKKVFHEIGWSFTQMPSGFLELYFLDWESRVKDFYGSIRKVLKAMDLERVADCVPRVRSIRAVSTFMDNSARGQGGHLSTEPSSLLSHTPPVREDDCYRINPDNPGVVLIINQEDFYTEPDPQYAHLLYPENVRYKLDTRLGTEKDKDRLQRVFERFRFDVQVETNLPHYEIAKVIADTVERVRNESSLFVCVLSHGGEGVVYGSNSCAVKVKQIESLMVKKNKTHLRGKPKVLILQSCQGTQCQKIDEEDEEEDGGHAQDGPNVPLTADMLTFWATVPGYAAIRNVNKGSWLVQTLCDEMEVNWDKYHLQDICTRVVDKVTQRKWKESKDCRVQTNIMTPLLVSTFRKKFCMPSRGI